MSTIDDISAKITGDASGYTAAMSSAQQATVKATSSMADSFKSTGLALDAGITVPLTFLAKTAVESFNAGTQAVAQMNAEIQGTGDASGFSSKELTVMASNLNAISGMGKTAIMQGVIDSLLKFQYISGDTFKDAANDAVGFAMESGTSLAEASQKIGAALENPTRAFNLLRMSIANISPAQRQAIENDMAMGKIGDAQTIIMGNLNKAYGKSAEAMAELPANQMKRDFTDMNDALVPLGGTIMSMLVPALNALDNVVRDVMTWFKGLSDTNKDVIVGLGALLGAIGPAIGAWKLMSAAGGALQNIFGPLIKGAMTLAASFIDMILPLLPWIAAVAGVVVVGKLLYDNWESIKSLGLYLWDALQVGVLSFGIAIEKVLSHIPGLGDSSMMAINQLSMSVQKASKDMQTNMANSMNSSVDIGKSFNDMAGWAQTAYDKIKSVAGGAIGSIQTWWAGLTTYQKGELKKQTQNNAGTSQQIEETWFEAFNKMHQFGQTLFEGMNTAMNDMVKGVTDSLTTGAADWRSITSKALSGMLDSVVQWGIKYLEVQLDIAKAFSFLDANPLLAIPLIVGLIAAVSALGMPAMANGGVFDQATAVTVGEAGPEVILPVTRLSNGKMGVGVQPSAGGGAPSSAGGSDPTASGSGSSGSPTFQVAVYLDSRPILKSVSKASREGRVVIHPSAVRAQSVNS